MTLPSTWLLFWVWCLHPHQNGLQLGNLYTCCKVTSGPTLEAVPCQTGQEEMPPPLSHFPWHTYRQVIFLKGHKWAIYHVSGNPLGLPLLKAERQLGRVDNVLPATPAPTKIPSYWASWCLQFYRVSSLSFLMRILLRKKTHQTLVYFLFWLFGERNWSDCFLKAV